MSPNVAPRPRVASRRSTPVSGDADVVAERPVEHHVEGVPGIALAEDDLARVEPDALEVGGQLGEGHPVEPREQRHAPTGRGRARRPGSRGFARPHPTMAATRPMTVAPRLDRLPAPGLGFRQTRTARWPGATMRFDATPSLPIAACRSGARSPARPAPPCARDAPSRAPETGREHRHDLVGSRELRRGDRARPRRGADATRSPIARSS